LYCPFCAHEETRVIDSRVVEAGGAVRRRRVCESCDKRFSSYERAELRLPMVVKKDGTRQAFDVEKIRKGMMKALEKRPAPTENVAASLHAILREIQGESEVTVAHIGDCVMQQLQQLDGVAYVRFASVYREFKDMDEFLMAVTSAMGDEGLKQGGK